MLYRRHAHEAAATSPRSADLLRAAARFIHLAVLACVLWACPSQAAQADEAGRGALVIAGGEFQLSNPGWQRLAQLADGAGAPFLVFPTASAEPLRSGRRVVEHLQSLGLHAVLVPLGEKDFDRPPASIARDPAWVEQAQGASGFFFVGGDQERYRKAFYQPDDQPTPLLEAVRAAHRRGAVIGGTSAGAAIMSKLMFKAPEDQLSMLTRGPLAGRTLDKGLGFIGPDWFVDQHFLARGRFARTLLAMAASGYRRGVGVDENTALIITPDRIGEVAGSGGVVVIDLSDAHSFALRPFRLEGARLHLLWHGDRLNMTDGSIAPATSRASTPILPADSTFRPFYEDDAGFWFPDVTAPALLADIMAKTLDSKQGRAEGLLFGHRAADDAALERRIGYHFTFQRGDGAKGWIGPSEGPGQPQGPTRTTIADIRVSVTPIVMAAPLFSPFVISTPSLVPTPVKP
jgi:cyanophycinase